jgi:hypothetical protein
MPHFPIAARVVTRSQALALNLRRYFTGRPCKHGHLSERFTNGGACIECMRAFGAERYASNPEYRAMRIEQQRDRRARARA